jgi:hypothetical protein
MYIDLVGSPLFAVVSNELARGVLALPHPLDVC